MTLKPGGWPVVLHRGGRVLGALVDEGRTVGSAFTVRGLLVGLLSRLMPSRTFPRLRARLYRFAGCRIADDVAVLGRIQVIGDPRTMYRNIRAGRGVYISHDCVFVADGSISLAEDAALAPAVRLITGFHSVGPSERRMAPGAISAPIAVGRGCFLGLGVTVLPGVSIGDGTVVGAGSVVTRDLPADVVAAGNPARVIRRLESAP